MKVALVTGGSKGIGLQVVIRLIELGYKVVTCSRSQETWTKVLAKYPKLNSVDYQTVDIADERALEKWFAVSQNSMEAGCCSKQRITHTGF